MAHSPCLSNVRDSVIALMVLLLLNCTWVSLPEAQQSQSSDWLVVKESILFMAWLQGKRMMLKIPSPVASREGIFKTV